MFRKFQEGGLSLSKGFYAKSVCLGKVTKVLGYNNQQMRSWLGPRIGVRPVYCP